MNIEEARSSAVVDDRQADTITLTHALPPNYIGYCA